MKTWSDAALPIDRHRGEGPPACCTRRLVAGDELVFLGELPATILAAVRASRPDWLEIPDAQLYACGSCRGRIFRHKVITRESFARGLGQSPPRVAKAWLHDEEFWHRGPSSAPAEAKAQPWWPQYQALATAAAPGQLQGKVQELLRTWTAG